MMINDVKTYFRKTVEVTDIDDNVYTGYVVSTESIADSDDGIASIDIVHTRQFPNDTLTLRTDEIKNIKLTD